MFQDKYNENVDYDSFYLNHNNKLDNLGIVYYPWFNLMIYDLILIFFFVDTHYCISRQKNIINKSYIT